MATGLVGQDWYNQNAHRSFPLSDEATAQDVTGSFTLPEDLIVDLTLPVSYAAGRSPEKFHLYEVAVFGAGVSIKIGYGGVWSGGSWSTSPAVVATVSVSSSHTENQSYFMYGTGDFKDSIGKITIGKLDTTFNFGGVYQFDQAGGRLVPTCIKPDIRSVSQITVRNGNDVSDPLYGDVELVAGNNIKIDVSGNTITFNATQTSNLDTDCGCSDTADKPLPDPIRTINGVGPNSSGNFTFNPIRCLTLSGITNGLKLDDECATPCCTSEELERVIEDLNQLNRDTRLHFTTMSQLENRLQQMSSLIDSIEATGFIVDTV